MRPPWLVRTCAIIPAYQAEATLAGVVANLREALPELAGRIFVVDDGSTDDTAGVALATGCQLLSHPKNKGKGAALLTGFSAAQTVGYEVAMTVDADGQHPASEARRVLLASGRPDAFVLGTRDLARAGAPRKNRLSNQVSNFFLSHFAERNLRDTQCGLRRYPIRATLQLAARGRGYDFEAEVLLRAIWAGHEVVEQPIDVVYPADRVTHFHVVRDPWRIVRAVVVALKDHHFGQTRQ